MGVRLRYVALETNLPSFNIYCFYQDGFTVILVEKGSGIETRQIKTSYSTTAGTAFITFDNARAPVGNTLGEEGGGIFVMLRCVLSGHYSVEMLSRLPVILTMSDG